MSTDALRTDLQPVTARVPAQREAAGSIWKDVEQLLRPLASLRLTVVLFAAAIFLIFVGTLAQTTSDVWVVLRTYFRTWYAWVPFQGFFPRAFFPDIGDIPGGFYFPGGFTIGTLMAINLLAAHGLRFKMQASGARLWAGLGVIATGAALTWLVIITQQDSASLTGIASSNWQPVWLLLKVLLAGIWGACAYRLFTAQDSPTWQRWALSIIGVASGGLFCWLIYLYFTGQEWPLGGSSMRILWQLMKATAAGVVLLAGCVLVFRKRAGIVLLHSGILLMMANELVVDQTHVEAQLTLREGETKDWVQDTRTVELAVSDKTDPQSDKVVVIPRSMLAPGAIVRDERLPFDVEVLEHYTNSDLVRAGRGNRTNPADQELGLDWLAIEREPGTGTDADQKVDVASAYITLLKKGTDKALGTYLVSVWLADPTAETPPQRVNVDGKKYDLALRFERHYKPYSVHLDDVRRDDYPGTNTPKNYSSDVKLVDQTVGVDRSAKIWMNNPYRYGGDTFYQSGYEKRGETEFTTLSVVSNTGWMIPYVGCMIVAVGLLAQFWITLTRFIQRRSQAPLVATVVPTSAKHKTAKRAADAEPSGFAVWAPRLFPLVIVVVFGGYILSKLRTPPPAADTIDLYEFGKLPVMYQGRVKPFDTLARQALTVMSNRQTFRVPASEEELSYVSRLAGIDTKPEPAIRWLLDMVARPQLAEGYEIFRIDSPDVLAALDLKPRKGFRYSWNEIWQNNDLNNLIIKARKVEKNDRGTFEKKLLELATRVETYRILEAAMVARPIPPPPQDPAQVREYVEAVVREQDRFQKALLDAEPPLAVVDRTDKRGWTAFSLAAQRTMMSRIFELDESTDPSLVHLATIFDAYGKKDAQGFNRAVDKYHAYLATDGPEELAEYSPSLEAFFNNAEPYYYAMLLYVAAFVLTALAWLGWSGPLNRAAFWLLTFTFAYHTISLVVRIAVSGRPPVTNLYSSALFIGWGAVLMGLVYELIFGRKTGKGSLAGIGNLMASIAGFGTLLIAHLLLSYTSTSAADKGDTMAVMQAVLDTQFWLATHVVCVTLGYATTIVAGLFGLIYILRGVFTRSLTPESGKELIRMTYGTVCFAIFFSFVGTVLGGLWADDSWGRFWGWDPKENGALIIVLWNALVLHARWGGLVKDQGLALLAVVGNIVVSWSWFGVNQLQIGLHSYGFTEGVLMCLGWFVASQVAVMLLGMLPAKLWRSSANLTVAA